MSCSQIEQTLIVGTFHLCANCVLMKTFCLDSHTDWDNVVRMLLLAERETCQESLGFSTFELFFGHSIWFGLSYHGILIIPLFHFIFALFQIV
jgi:hypothetical protein